MGRIKGRSPAYQPPLIEPVDPHPESTRFHQHSQGNWEIREFMAFLRRRGATTLDFGQVQEYLLEFRGVDKAAYEAEAALIRSKYRWLYAKHGMGEDTQVTDDRKPPAPVKVKDDGLSLLMARVRGKTHGEDG